MKLLNLYFAALLISFVLILPANSNASNGALKATTAIGDTLGAFNAGILTPLLDQSLGGLIFAEGHYWITGSNAQAGWQRMLYKISADGQTLLDHWTLTPPTFIGVLRELAYDGQFLYTTGIETIYQIDMATGQFTGVEIPAPYYYAGGLTYDPATDHFWVSGDGNLIYEINRQGTIIRSIAFPNDSPAIGLAWDVWTIGGPYLWVWSMKYTNDDVRPKAFQIKASTGQLTGLTFEGVHMFPPTIDGALSFCLSSEVIPGKVVFTALQSSHFQQQGDNLDWVVLYDLDPNGTFPGPIINVNPTFIQNNLIFNDSIELDITVFNLSEQFDLNWLAVLEYPENETNPPGDVLLDFNGTELTSPISDNGLRSVTFLNDHFYFSTTFGGIGNDASIYKIAKDGSTVEQVIPVQWVNYGGSALTTDGTYLYASAQYYIAKFDPVSQEVVDIILNTNFSPTAMAYDMQNDLLYLGGINSMRVINLQGQVVNFYTTPFPIAGLSWDSWSPGGPFLWAQTADSIGPVVHRLHPTTGMFTDVSFRGEMVSDSTNIPGDIFVTPDWQQNKLVMGALQRSETTPGNLDDLVLVYDLAITPPPGWIDLLGATSGTVEPLSSNSLTLKLKAIMSDTLMTANIVINNNTIMNSTLKIPVIFEMMPDNTVSVGQLPADETGMVQQLFPNPATDRLNVRFGNLDSPANINIFNSLGAKVLSAEIAPGADTQTLDISRLPAGFYNLLVNTGKSIEQHTFIKN
jgi:hypothetical protein